MGLLLPLLLIISGRFLFCVKDKDLNLKMKPDALFDAERSFNEGAGIDEYLR